MDLNQTIRCIVKLGGAAITCKHELEKINEENLETVSSQLRQAMNLGSCSNKVIGMDWSKRDGVLDISSSLADFDDQRQFTVDFSRFVVVHGAGSFGHFQASKSGVHKGGLSQPLVKAGFVATRISVTTLNLEIVRALAREGIPSIGMSPYACGWSTSERNVASADLSGVTKAIDSGFIPVLHGDAVFDDRLGCTILSGDVIIRHLAEHLRPEYVVFLTDVSGVYDRPPTDPNAVLLREIAVDEDGKWSVVKPTPQSMNMQVEITVAAHDTTGGMVTKISEAALIAKLGIDVYIVNAATIHSLKALRGELRHNIPDDWLGTVIRFSR
ncbi:WRKY DNA-binding protein 4, putative isoform 1 [Hibiscus syriacus]|uniref:Isopentenyl phosphate kinase n=1 Tax=Hibiscus syriacus TaxID=106335 RepID=A0A6A2XD92_HIBSY|nr:isopentenyl phosphate kinase-like [Hibiscus syriacus]XP_039034684.1 isopentenyl phosphate kinase-like [Hibiscus syriacus]KAE8673272.1 WRKY DNA-binding protein 4, putative isoform 1 [Hibiscus syriacus]